MQGRRHRARAFVAGLFAIALALGGLRATGAAFVAQDSPTASWSIDAFAGSMRGAGENGNAQLGDGTSFDRWTFTAVSGGVTTWISAAAGDQFSCAIKADGTLWCWGGNFWGQIGQGVRYGTYTTPTQVGTGTSWATVAAGDGFACATKSDGTLWCWGNNTYSQLGQGDTTVRASPTQVGTATSWKTVTVAGSSACGLRTDGTIWCWGSNRHGELGDGTTTDRSTPKQVLAGTTWTAISIGGPYDNVWNGPHACALKSDGTIWCWGENLYMQLGRDNPSGNQDIEPSPAQVGTATDWATVSSGYAHTCATKLDGRLYCWGSNGNGQLGQGSTTPAKVLTPTQAMAGSTFRQVAAAYDSTFALRSDGTLWVWGVGSNGTLGLNSTSQQNSPVQVTAPATAKRIGSGSLDHHTLIIS